MHFGHYSLPTRCCWIRWRRVPRKPCREVFSSSSVDLSTASKWQPFSDTLTTKKALYGGNKVSDSLARQATSLISLAPTKPAGMSIVQRKPLDSSRLLYLR